MLPANRKPSLYLRQGVVVLRDGRRQRRLTNAGASILFALMCWPRRSSMDLAEILWPNPNTMPDGWRDALYTHVKVLRQSLAPFRLGIYNWYGEGFTLKEQPMAEDLTTVRLPTTHWINIYERTDKTRYCSGPFDTEAAALGEVPNVGASADDDYLDTVVVSLTPKASG